MSATPRAPLELHRRVVDAAEETDSVISRAMLRGMGVTRNHVRRHVLAGRWTTHGAQTVAVRDAPLGPVARRWRAVWETGLDIAVVDGVSALQAAGLTGWDDDVVHVSTMHHHNARDLPGIKVHKVIRRVDAELVNSTGLPRTKPPVAAIRAAHWAVTDRQAATILAMTVQQRLATGEQLMAARRAVRGRTRRAFIMQVVRDVVDGAQSLGELDFAVACRARGLPEPTRQVVRRGSRGTVYLDVYFDEHRLVIEIDGAGHLWGLNGVADALRANQVVIDGDRVIRINIIGWRLEQETFMGQVAAALRSDWAQANVARGRGRAPTP